MSPHMYSSVPPSPNPSSAASFPAALIATPWFSSPAGLMELTPQFAARSLASPSKLVWYMDTVATSHMTADLGILTSQFNLRTNSPQHVGVDDGSHVPITHAGHTTLPHTPYHLQNALITPKHIKNLVSIRQFTRDN